MTDSAVESASTVVPTSSSPLAQEARKPTPNDRSPTAAPTLGLPQPVTLMDVLDGTPRGTALFGMTKQTFSNALTGYDGETGG